MAIAIESEGYFAEEDEGYYGYYAVDYKKGQFEFGLHAEQIDQDLQYGPHFSFSKSIYKFKLEYFIGFEQAARGHTVRMAHCIFF